MSEKKIKYVEISPIIFIKEMLQREVTLNELLLLDYIQENYQFEQGIINLFIEQVLKMNNNKLTRGFTLKIASEWDRASFQSFQAAERYANKEYERFIQLQRRDNFGEIRELTSKEKEIVNRVFYKSSLNDEVLDCVIGYCMKINDGYIISWFINRIVEYLENHDVKTKVEAEDLIHTFHEKYILSFGIAE